MASINYLWKNRVKPKFGSKRFFIIWAKRILTSKRLLIRNFRRYKICLYGSVIDDTAELGKLKIDGPKSFLTVGKNSFIGNIYMALHANISIGENVCINDRVELLTASHEINDPNWTHLKGEITIEDYVWVGTGAMILPGVTIGKGAVIGARSVIAKNVAPYSIVVGNPAKPLAKTRSKDLRYNPCEFLAANRAWLVE